MLLFSKNVTFNFPAKMSHWDINLIMTREKSNMKQKFERKDKFNFSARMSSECIIPSIKERGDYVQNKEGDRKSGG